MMLRNFASSILIKIIVIIMGLTIIPIIITKSGLSVFGEYSTYLAYLNLFLFFNTGFSQSIIKNLSKNYGRQRTYSQSIVMGSLVFIFISLVFFSWFYFFEKESWIILCILLFNFIFMYFSAFFSSYLNAYELIYKANNAELVGGITRSTLLMFSAYFAPGVESLLLSTAISYFITFIFLCYMVCRNTNLRLTKISLRKLGSVKIIKEVMLFSSSEACWRLFSSLDKVLIQKLLGDAYVAIYNIAFTVCIRLLEVSGIFAQIALPRFVKEGFEKAKVFKKLFLFNLIYLLLQNLSLYIFLDTIITIWLGEDIAKEVVPLLNIMLAGVFFGGMNYVVSPYMVSNGDIKIILLNNLISISFIYFCISICFYINRVDLFVFSLMFNLYFMLIFFLNLLKVYKYDKSGYICT